MAGPRRQCHAGAGARGVRSISRTSMVLLPLWAPLYVLAFVLGVVAGWVAFGWRKGWDS